MHTYFISFLLIQFFSFPKDETLKLEWVRNIHRGTGKPGEFWKPGKDAVICSLHFTPESYKQSAKGEECRTRRLKDDAVPIIFSSRVPRPPQKRREIVKHDLPEPPTKRSKKGKDAAGIKNQGEAVLKDVEHSHNYTRTPDEFKALYHDMREKHNDLQMQLKTAKQTIRRRDAKIQAMEGIIHDLREVAGGGAGGATALPIFWEG